MNKTTTAPSAEELALWTAQVRDWFNETGRKRIARDMKQDLAAQGARWCPNCRTVLRIEEFPSDRTQADGLRSRCRPCHNGACAEYNREYMRERRRDPEYREREREYSLRYRAEHLEEMRAYGREHNRNRYRTDELHRLRRQLDSGFRRAVKAGNEADWITAEELLTYWEARGIDPLVCILTGETLTPQTRSVDHATPIGRGGAHTVSNLIPVSFDANHAKGNRTVLEFMADRAEARTAEEYDDLPEHVQRALSPSAPAREIRVLEINPEALED